MNKYLIIRFSSFGDIAQALPCAAAIRTHDPHAEIHFLTRSDFNAFVGSYQEINKTWSLDRSRGLKGLLEVSNFLKKQNFTHIYDAHSNLRSLIVCLILRFRTNPPKYIKRPKERLKRILLFWFHVNFFAKPFKGALSYLEPLKNWFKNVSLPPPLKLNLPNISTSVLNNTDLSQLIAIAPSATWEMKRWPTEHWGELAKKMPELQFILLAGTNDNFCDEIVKMSPNNILNLRGDLSWLESTAIIAKARVVISGDTGLLHVADILGTPAIAILGPTAFGHPSRSSTLVAESNLHCRPCTKDGRGRCSNTEYKKCLKDVKPEHIIQLLNKVTSH